MIREFQKPGGVGSAGWAWAAGLTLATTVHGVLHHAFFFIGMRLGQQLRTSSIALLYNKSIHLAAGSASAGVVVNLVSNDLSPFEQLALFGHSLWVALIEIPICSYLLYRNLSWPSLLGLAVIFLVIPMQGWFGRQFHTFRKRMVKSRDSRIRLMSDLITGIQLIKLQGWRSPFISEVERVRHQEMKDLKNGNIFDAGNEALFFIFPLLVSLVTYGTSVAAGIPLSAPSVFSSVALFNVMRLTLTTFVPKSVKGVTEAVVSLRRLEDFLTQPETESRGAGRAAQATSLKDVDATQSAIRLTDAHFEWDAFALQSVSIDFKQASLTAVIGPVGAGKSSLMQALLGEMPSVRITTPPSSASASQLYVDSHHRTMAYAPQTPWVLAGTIMDNILFSHPLDETWLRSVVAICSLERDLEQWPHGLATIVGDRGVALSGGQKARLALARAVYARAPVLLLDDPLSAVDTRVARRIFDAVRSAPELAHTTRILVTHQLQFVAECDQVVVLEKGGVEAVGSWDEVRAQHDRRVAEVGEDAAAGDWMAILREYDQQDADADASAAAASGAGATGAADDDAAAELVGAAIDIKGDTAGAAAVAAAQVETSQVGTVHWSTFVRFLIRPTSWWTLIAVLVGMFGAQTAAAASDWHLAQWSRKPADVQLNDPFYLTLYWSLILGAVVIGIARALVVYSLMLNSSLVTSKDMLHAVLDAPLSWFSKNRSGQILNRFSKDQSIIDEMLPSVLFNTVQCLFQAFAVLVVVIAVLPWIALSIPVLGVAFVALRRMYIGASRSIKRIEAVTRSPVYSHLSASLEGLPVIRALGAQALFAQRFAEYTDANTRAIFAQAGCARWLGVRLDLMSSVFLGVAAFLAQGIAVSGSLPAALAGLALSYTLQLNGLLQWLVRQTVECEVMFVSVERMLEYVDVPREADLPSTDVPPADWPTKGDLVIRNMSLTYPGSGAQPVLRDWNVEFKAGERIGIVGRTGAGKSSFFAALFRSYPYQGIMMLDGINTATLQVEALRQRLSIIPQEPFLFKGTLRFNLDPFAEYADADLWHALSRVELQPAIERLDGKLDAPVDDGGANFSVGQRQLLCLARSLLKKSRVLVCDEATANIDFRSDALIQKVLKNDFGNETLVLTIAHRLSTVLDYDRILVLDGGRIVEFAHAWELLQIKDGVLARMVEDTGEEGARQLREMARISWEDKQSKLRRPLEDDE
ncbi:P-loop containing nucleoside triphosphate hydrolase protein [Blastocladiella britannica]|nr:P-loop containing nucleoside triphosphate hydrolase protein [Blastocladiella britannica]